MTSSWAERKRGTSSTLNQAHPKTSRSLCIHHSTENRIICLKKAKGEMIVRWSTTPDSFTTSGCTWRCREKKITIHRRKRTKETIGIETTVCIMSQRGRKMMISSSWDCRLSIQRIRKRDHSGPSIASWGLTTRAEGAKFIVIFDF